MTDREQAPSGGQDPEVVGRPPGYGRRRAVVATGVIALLGAGLLGAAVGKAALDTASAAAEAGRYSPPPFIRPTPRSTGPLVVVIGDDSAADVSTTTTSWPALLESSTGGRVEVAASQGAGYTTPGTNGNTFEQAVASAPPSADVVVFVGGSADAAASKVDLAQAATSTFSAAAKRSPVAQILVIGPIVDGDATATQVTSVARVLRGAARLNDLEYADPAASDWLPNGGRVVDRSDLTQADETAIAERLERMIRSVRN